MGLFEKFFRSLSASPRGTSSFEGVSEEKLNAFLAVSRYGSFELTDATRPSFDRGVVPTEGYRHGRYCDGEHAVPVLVAAVTRKRLFQVFLDLTDTMGSMIDVILETSHGRQSNGHDHRKRDGIDLPVLQSTLWDFEDLLLNDGCTGIAVLNPSIPQELQFDEHKLFIVYGDDLSAQEGILKDYRIACREEMKFITEAEHIHQSRELYVRTFDELAGRLGAEEGCN